MQRIPVAFIVIEQEGRRVSSDWPRDNSPDIPRASRDTSRRSSSIGSTDWPPRRASGNPPRETDLTMVQPKLAKSLVADLPSTFQKLAIV